MRNFSEFFAKANRARRDFSEQPPILLAPLWRNGSIIAEVPARIVGVLSREQDAYFIEYLHAPGEPAAAFGYRLKLV